MIPPLQEIQPVVEFQTEIVEILPSQSGPVEISLVEISLIADIVNGQHRAGPAELFVLRIESAAEVDAAERGVPVVRLQDIRSQTEVHRQLHRRPAEKNIPLRIIGILLSVPVVEVRPVEEAVILDEVPAQILSGAQDIDFRPFAPLSERDAQKIVLLIEFQIQFPHQLRIVRHHDRDLVPPFGKRRGKCRGDIRKSAGFRKGNRFAGDPENVHGRILSFFRRFHHFGDFICSRAFLSVSISSSERLFTPFLESLSRMRSISSDGTGPFL